MPRIAVCPDDALPEGEAVKIDSPVSHIAVIRSAGELYAVTDRCSHGNASMSEGYIEDDGTVECPLHAARFCLKTGVALCQPATEPLNTYPVVVDAGTIYVEIPETV
ncbi:3-phenylpropionate/cinnamic acid dioxygenase ferredoxin subunit [Kerstersia gyiorum]|uniref:3-phenylpropionate/cinnamic acid dioxygenase ferredoxin subunit n=1 Tax=Kerstersia gyiorum TaxID=206506 RepID=UPI0030D53AEA